jgi:hypothetical protein
VRSPGCYTLQNTFMTLCPMRSLRQLLQALSWSEEAAKAATEPTVVGVAKSLGMDGSALPGWFATLDFKQVRGAQNLSRRELLLSLSHARLRMIRSPRSASRSSTPSCWSCTASFVTTIAGADSSLRVLGLVAQLALP